MNTRQWNKFVEENCKPDGSTKEDILLTLTPRREAIFRCLDRGESFSEIAQKAGVTRERIRQIVNETREKLVGRAERLKKFMEI